MVFAFLLRVRGTEFGVGLHQFMVAPTGETYFPNYFSVFIFSHPHTSSQDTPHLKRSVLNTTKL